MDAWSSRSVGTSGAGRRPISLSLRHQRLSFGFSSIRFSHRADRGLDDRNYTWAASEKDVFKTDTRVRVPSPSRKDSRLIGSEPVRGPNWLLPLFLVYLLAYYTTFSLRIRIVALIMKRVFLFAYITRERRKGRERRKLDLVK